MTYKYVLFDLDGTLTDPKVGITKSVAYALKRLKELEIDPDLLTPFIGPPLKESFMTYYHLTEKEAGEAIKYYREYFKARGIYENEPYEGIDSLLRTLKEEQDMTLAVATSKPTVFADEILKHFGLKDYFTCIYGSNMDGSRTRKAEVIEAVMSHLSISSEDEVVMVGDREHDIIGAREMSIDAVGVRYGYSLEGELEAAGADYIVNSIRALEMLLIDSDKYEGYKGGEIS